MYTELVIDVFYILNSTVIDWTCYIYIFSFLARQPPVGPDLLIHEVSRSHTTTQHSRWDSSGRVISSSQKPVPDNTHKRQTSMSPGGIRTHNLSRRAALDLRLRPRCHWDRLFIWLDFIKLVQRFSKLSKVMKIYQNLNKYYKYHFGVKAIRTPGKFPKSSPYRRFAFGVWGYVVYCLVYLCSVLFSVFV